MQIGDMNVVESILNLERQMYVMQKMIGYIALHNKENLKAPTIKSIEEWNEEAIKELQRKYPKMDIKKK